MGIYSEQVARLPLYKEVAMSSGRVEITGSVQYVRLEGDFVLMDLKGGSYFGLDAVVSHIWMNLAEHGDVGWAVDELCLDYDVEPAQALADVERWVAELAGKKLVVVEGEGEGRGERAAVER